MIFTTTKGFTTVPQAVDQEVCSRIAARIDGPAALRAGTRHGLTDPDLSALGTLLACQPEVARWLPSPFHLLSCHVFDKQAGRNWSVPFHRDVHVPVRGRVDSPLLHDVAQKEGAWFARTDRSVLATLVAVRLCLDDHTPQNGPLRLIPGSHLPAGPEDPALALSMLLRRGDALVMSPLLLHASSRASQPSRRRTLHFTYAPATLPDGSAWP